MLVELEVTVVPRLLRRLDDPLGGCDQSLQIQLSLRSMLTYEHVHACLARSTLSSSRSDFDNAAGWPIEKIHDVLYL